MSNVTLSYGSMDYLEQIQWFANVGKPLQLDSNSHFIIKQISSWEEIMLRVKSQDSITALFGARFIPKI